MKGYRTYAASAWLALLAILHTLTDDPVIKEWILRGGMLALAAAFTFLRSAMGSQWTGLLETLRQLAEKELRDKFSPPIPPVMQPSGPDFNPFVVSVPAESIECGPGDEIIFKDDPPMVVVGGQLSEPFPLTPGSGNPLLPLLAFLLLAGTASAAGPKAIINGPATAVPGELVTLDASGSQGENLRFRWSVQPDQPGRIMFEECPKGSGKIRISTFPGVWHYTLFVFNADDSDVLTWTITVPGNPSPAPTPNPSPNPAPTPTPPTPPVPPQPTPSAFGIRDQIAGWANSVASPTRAADAAKLASAADSLAAAVAAGTTSGPAKILAALTAANALALGGNIGAWKSFGVSYSAALSGLYAMGRLKTDADWAAMLRETADGLRGVK